MSTVVPLREPGHAVLYDPLVPPNQETVDLEDLIAARIRDLRVERGWTQDDLARRVREIGLPWNRAVVAAVETQTRRLGFGELTALLGACGVSLPLFLRGVIDDAPDAASLSGGPLITKEGLHDLLASTGEVQAFEPHRIGGDLPPREDIAAVLDGYRRSGDLARVLEIVQEPATGTPAEDANLDRIPNLPGVLRYLEDATGEFEQYAARRLGMEPLVVSLLSHLLWGRSATDERDQRAPDGPKHRASREIVDELAAALGGSVATIADSPAMADGPGWTSGDRPRLEPRLSPAASPRYRPLSEWLRLQAGPRARTSFDSVEGILGRVLPPSARRHRAWWANDPTHSHARAWLAAGWIVESADVLGETVTFERPGGGPR